ncbi:Pantothenate precursors transporter PanS [Pseudoalteromonas holothuriae]|uniref:Pantothenates transporter PanS n=1 Tax=Pseudoalteromonas holothuriae TaxID=2963714 RepID=A0A9W4QQM2_9GAMM|nr:MULTISPECIES: bile acid:sodium symporter family protein [unclassified Pseudoalteromonas]CAH9049429.1 Pantothenate precursors transporter PanS [Pseudoalteromonas sp. CIP111854]CAH9055967.1 Pantothenate precursors transporter PanS [Pseudoalteromonas sp. CIP111951]
MIATVNIFPLWAILLSTIAFFFPTLFIDYKAAIIPLLMFIMLTMGLTLTTKDFARVFKNKKAVWIAVVLQFTVMPLLAFTLASLMHFDTDLLIGMVLVGTVAGGTASNVMCYLAKGDVALSISMTAISTLLGVLLTPLLTSQLIGQVVDIPILAMLSSLLKIVLLPVVAGVLFNHFFARPLAIIKPQLPLFSMSAIVIIIAIIVALNHDKLQSVGLIVLLGVVLHNTLGLLLGYFVPKYLGQDEQVCRTIAFEVAMQNSGLAVALAMKFFTPTAAIAGTLFSIWHNISGSILAGIWSNTDLYNKSDKHS